MESSRLVLAVVLMIAVVVIVNVIFPSPRRPEPRERADSTRVATPPSAPATGAAIRQAPVPAEAPDPIVQVPATPTSVDTIFVETPLYRFGFSTRGASLVSAELLNHKSYTRSICLTPSTAPTACPVQLAPAVGTGLVSYRLRVGGQPVDISRLDFVSDRSGDLQLAGEGGTDSLRFTHVEPAGGTIEITYRFVPNDYVIDVTTRVAGIQASQVMLDLAPTLEVNEANEAEDHRALAYVVNSRRDGIRSVPLKKLRGNRVEEGPLEWVALKNKYFVLAAITGQGAETPGFGGLLAAQVPAENSANLTATLPLSRDGVASYRAYIGPQEPDRLKALGSQLEDVNPYGWRWIRPVIRPIGHAFTWILLEARRATGLDYGWILILFGVAVRIALWPLNAKAMRSQLKSMELQPRIKEIQTKYKSDPERFQKEMLKLYKEEGFNPMGGCVPLLIPMPVLITLFFVFQGTIEFRGVSFLWLPDLALADPLYLLPILLGVTMFLQQWLSVKNSPPNPQAKMMMWFMPGFMTILFLNFASGLNLYYLAQNFASFPQQLQLIRERQRYQASRASLTPVRT